MNTLYNKIATILPETVLQLCADRSTHAYNEDLLHLLGFNALYFVQTQTTFRRNILPPSSSCNNKPNKSPRERQQVELGVLLQNTELSIIIRHRPQDSLTDCSQSVSNRLTLFLVRVISLILKMDATSSSETSVYNKPTRRHIREDGILHSHRRENLKPYWLQVVLILSIGGSANSGLSVVSCALWIKVSYSSCDAESFSTGRTGHTIVL
jgi:hypothetical protein